MLKSKIKTTLLIRLFIPCLALVLLTCAQSSGTNVSGTISTNSIWRAVSNPYIVTATMTVASNATLTIEPGVHVQLYQTARIDVYGSVYAQGTASNMITFYPYPGHTYGGGILFSGESLDNLCSTGVLEHCDFNMINRNPAMFISFYAILNISDCSISNMPGNFFNVTGSELQFIGNEFYNTGEAITATQCRGLIASNHITKVNGYADGIDLNEAWVGPGWDNMDIIGNIVRDGIDVNADAIDLGTSPELVKGNIIINWGDKGISVGEDSDAIIIDNVISRCNIGIGVKDASAPLMANNTIANCNYGIRSYPKYTVYGGRGCATNMIIWNCTKEISLDGDSTLNIGYSVIDGTNLWPGIGNSTNDPMFVGLAQHDLHLKTGSPCINTGLNMDWMAGDTDPDGNARIINSTVDIGGFEYAPLRQEVKVRYPDGYEVIEIGGTYSILWTAYGTNWPAGSTATLQMSSDGGANWSDMAGATSLPVVPDTVQTYSWNTLGLLPGSEYKIKVFYNLNPSIVDESDNTCILMYPVLQHFNWAAISSPQTSEVPFSVTITAVSASDVTVTNFANDVYLSAWATGRLDQTVGKTGSTWMYPMATTNHDARTQVIYLPSEIGSARTINSLALNVITKPAMVMTNWTIRMKHTPLSSYGANPTWDQSGWTTVYQTNQLIASTGWVTFAFSTPFDYNGGSNLMVDFSFNGTAGKFNGYCIDTATNTQRAIYQRTDSAYGDPLSWSGTNPVPASAARFPNIKLSSRSIPMTPQTVSGFTDGMWTGPVTVFGGATSMYLLASDGNGHTGDCNRLEMRYIADLSLVMPSYADEGSVVTGLVTVSQAPSGDITVQLVSDDTTEATVPGTVTISSGQTSTTFVVTAVDDLVLDGTHNARITASATSYRTAIDTVSVRDAETGVLTVELPASAVENAGVLTTQGLVTVGSPPQSDVDIFLSSSDSTEATVPWAVTIPSGSTSVTFDVTIVNDGEIDGNKSVLITAHADNWTDGSDTINVIDNENTNLVLQIPASTSENAGVLTNAGKVTISGTYSNNLIVSLASSITNELTVPATVTILASQTSATFNITVVDDTILDGSQVVTLTASASSFTSGIDTILVADNDAHHFAFSSISTPQFRNTPFSVTIEARDTNNTLISAFTDTVNLSAAGDQGPLSLCPVTTAPFVNGQWSGNITSSNISTGVRLTANDGFGHTGTSTAFSVQLTVPNHFDWSPVSTQQYMNIPFPVTITAKLTNDVVATDYTGTNSISGLTFGQEEQTIGIGDTSFYYPLRTSYAYVRTEVIYPKPSVGNSRTLTALALDILSLPGQPMENWTIRMKHTASTNYVLPYSWNNTGWTTVYQTNSQDIVSTGLVTFTFSTPFDYNAASNLMVSFSFSDSSFTYDGYCRCTQTSTNDVRMIFGRTGNIAYSDPLAWTGTRPTIYRQFAYPCIKLSAAQDEVSVSIAPTTTTSFVNGVWSGNVTVFQIATNAYLRTSDGSHGGDSGLFNVGFGHSLQVISARGTGVPPVGTNTYADGTVLSCRMSATVTDGVLATQYFCRGWTGTGSITPSGTTTNTGNFSLALDSTITWLWQTNLYLNTEAGEGGTVNVVDGWCTSGTTVVISAMPNANYHFDRWTGDTGACTIVGNQITAPMTRPRLITASFAADVIPFNPTNFGYSMCIRFAGHDAGETLTNFPALVLLNQTRSCSYGTTPTNLNYTQFASASGYDLRFTDASTNVLYYEVEGWNTNGDSYIWVQVPLLSGTNTSIWAWWGNASDVSRPAYTTNGSTWTSDYLGVWHLKEDHAGTGNASVYSDSTAHGNSGTDDVSATGKVGVAYYGQQNDGTNDYIQLEPAPATGAPLGASNFTLSVWFKRTGAGVTTSAGGGIVTNAEPLLTKGRAESDGGTQDLNYFLAVDASTMVLVADIEEGVGGVGPLGANHPVFGVTPVSNDTWTYAAVSYDGTWKLYLNGRLDIQLAVGQPPRWDSIQPAAIGSALNTSGTAAGAFNGYLDEARIANVVHSANWIKSCFLMVASNDTFAVYSTGTALAPLGTPIWWLASYGLTNEAYSVEEIRDRDGDGLLNWEEWVAGTIPTNKASTLRFVTASAPTNGRVCMTFASVVSDKVYQVWSVVQPAATPWNATQYATSPSAGFVSGTITARTGNSITLYVNSSLTTSGYYRISVK